uniref:Uncharacterized protein n=1 Tax=Anguilla anguilla TaxID=7936 RepID=A0A0E9UC45_ANGAN
MLISRRILYSPAPVIYR